MPGFGTISPGSNGCCQNQLLDSDLGRCHPWILQKMLIIVDLFKDFGSVWSFLQQSVCETLANGQTHSNFKEIGELTMLPQKRLKRILDKQEFHIILIQLVSCGLVVSKYLKLLSLAPLFLLPGNFFPRLVRFASTAYH